MVVFNHMRTVLTCIARARHGLVVVEVREDLGCDFSALLLHHRLVWAIGPS